MWFALLGGAVTRETNVPEMIEADELRPFNKNLRRLMRMTQEMLALAEEGDRDRQDASCGILYGILRDTAYRLRNMAAEECKRHEDAGKWR